MKIQSPRFGTVEIEPSKIIEFPKGLPGFEDLHRFTLLHPEGQGQEPRWFVLQAVDDPDVAFHVVDPADLGFDFQIMLSDEDAGAIALGRPEDAAVVVILVKEGDGHVRANLKAPLVLNLEARRGVQHVFAELNFDVGSKGGAA